METELPRQDQGYTPDELLDWPREELENLDPVQLAATSSLTVAQFLERLTDVEERRHVLRQLSTARAAEVLSEMDEELAAEILSEMREGRAVRILDDFEPDDAADIVVELEDDVRTRLLSKMDPKSRISLEKLLRYDPDTAGGIMTSEVDTALEEMTVDEAITRIREFAGKHEDLHYVYVVNRARRLKGIVSLRKLIQANPDQKISSIMRTNILGLCTPDMDKEEVARLMGEYNLPDIAVVDRRHTLLGVITHDDILDVVRDEGTEDIQKLAGAGGDESVHDQITYSIRRRQPWLGINLLTAFLGSAVVYIFQHEIQQLPILAALMPIIAAVGGNSGQQALAVAIRSIALGEVQDADTRTILLKQAAIGLINGLVIGIAACGFVVLLGGSFHLGLVVFGAMILNMLLAGITGTFIPILLKRLNRDPAQSSSILLTTITDTGGFFIFLALGTAILL